MTEIGNVPVVVSRHRAYECPWFDVVVKDVRYPGRPRPRQFYSVELNDWVAVLAVGEDGRIPLVRQYRPAIERFELELPAGAVADSAPEETARRELLEETGYAAGEVILLGTLFTEAGRLSSRAWIYFAPGARRVAVPSPTVDEPLEVVLATRAELRTAIKDNVFALSSHVAAVGLALTRGLLTF